MREARIDLRSLDEEAIDMDELIERLAKAAGIQPGEQTWLSQKGDFLVMRDVEPPGHA